MAEVEQLIEAIEKNNKLLEELLTKNQLKLPLWKSVASMVVKLSFLGILFKTSLTRVLLFGTIGWMGFHAIENPLPVQREVVLYNEDTSKLIVKDGQELVEFYNIKNDWYTPEMQKIEDSWLTKVRQCILENKEFPKERGWW